MKERMPALLLHHGRTVHRRYVPFRSEFDYGVAMIDLDIDRLDEAHRQCRLFGVEERALFSFERKDHGAQEITNLRPWAEAQFQEAGISIPTGTIRLVTFPRHAFYKFAPISLWIALDEKGAPSAILYEVRNTFGERHIYAASLEGRWSRHRAPKSFHVSPFFDVSGTYAFSLRYDVQGLRLGVTTEKEGEPVHMASLATRAAPASDRNLLSTALHMPFSTLGVSLGIHWEALKLWLKGARYHGRPKKKTNGPTRACLPEQKPRNTHDDAIRYNQGQCRRAAGPERRTSQLSPDRLDATAD